MTTPFVCRLTRKALPDDGPQRAALNSGINGDSSSISYLLRTAFPYEERTASPKAQLCNVCQRS